MDDELDFENRLMSSSYVPEDNETDVSLRPRRLDDYIGQEKAKENLRIYINAAKGRGDSLDHVLLYGPPGLGKTTLSAIIANEMNVNIRITSGPAIEKQGDLAAILTNLSQGDILFIDEIHRLSKGVEEILYPAMEDFALDIIIGKGPSARSIRIDLPRFTLIGALYMLRGIARKAKTKPTPAASMRRRRSSRERQKCSSRGAILCLLIVGQLTVIR